MTKDTTNYVLKGDRIEKRIYVVQRLLSRMYKELVKLKRKGNDSIEETEKDGNCNLRNHLWKIHMQKTGSMFSVNEKMQMKTMGDEPFFTH